VSATEERNYVEAARREKRAELERLGVAPFAYRFERSHLASEALSAYDDAMGENGPEVRVAGRISAWRSQGKTAFAHLEDGSGEDPGLLPSRWSWGPVRLSEAARPGRPYRREREVVSDADG